MTANGEASVLKWHLPASAAALECKVPRDLRVLKVFPESLVPLDLSALPERLDLLGLSEQLDLLDLLALPERLDLLGLSEQLDLLDLLAWPERLDLLDLSAW
jgi:hypothetical protein